MTTSEVGERGDRPSLRERAVAAAQNRTFIRHGYTCPVPGCHHKLPAVEDSHGSAVGRLVEHLLFEHETWVDQQQ